jgi:transcriptional regulator with XRE-family HTH domain
MNNFDNYFEKQMQNEEFRKEYDNLEPQYEIIRQIIKERNELNLTQKQLAERLGLNQSNISRLESGNYNPSIEFLQKIAEGLGKELHIEFREPKKVY